MNIERPTSNVEWKKMKKQTFINCHPIFKLKKKLWSAATSLFDVSACGGLSVRCSMFILFYVGRSSFKPNRY